jgi:hypothetical protein
MQFSLTKRLVHLILYGCRTRDERNCTIYRFFSDFSGPAEAWMQDSRVAAACDCLKNSRNREPEGEIRRNLANLSISAQFSPISSRFDYLRFLKNRTAEVAGHDR